MTITQASHKVRLVDLFYPGGKERSFPLALLGTASATLKKLADTAKEEQTDTGATLVKFDDTPVEFGVDEAKLLKDLLDDIKVATISEFKAISELKDLLK
jgi:hypothetical protein